LGNVSVSVLCAPEVSTPAAVNAPWAITLDLFEVVDVDMSWKVSVLAAVAWLLAAAIPVPPSSATAVAATAAEVFEAAEIDYAVPPHNPGHERKRWLPPPFARAAAASPIPRLTTAG